MTLLKLAEYDHVLLVTMHHIISDGWSLGVFVREFTALYAAFTSGAPPALPPLPLQYADFANWQRQWLRGDVLERQVAYWRKQLAGMPVLELPTDRPRLAVQTVRGATRSFLLPLHLSEQIKTLSTEERATPFMTLLAAFHVMLHYNSGQTDIVVGTDVANRNSAATEGLIGFFVNQLVLRTRLSGNPTFREHLARVREVTLDAYAHQDLPFDKLVAALNPERDLSRSPLFDVKLVLQNAPLPEATLSGLTLGLVELEFETTKFDLLLNLRDTPRGFQGQLAYGTDLFDSARIVRMLDQFEAVLRHVVSRPHARLADLVDELAQEERNERVHHERTRKKANLRKLKDLRRTGRQAPAPPGGDRVG